MHGLSGQWLPLASALTGSYNQCTAYVDSALDPEAWEKIPPIPPYPFAGSGCVVEFVSYCESTVAARPGYEAIRALFEREGIRFAHREVTVRLADGKVSDLDADQREAVTAAAQATIDEDMHDAAQ